jgi:oxygen-independent coproporphyrinogen-3 oxidase
VRRGRDAREDEAESFVPPAALYVHVPICASKCAYCDFYSVPAASLGEGFEAELVEATLARASALATRFEAEAFETVYVGGGTPSMLSPRALDRLLEGIGSIAGGRGGRGRGPREWTVEANPDSLGPEAVSIMRRHGVTRLSIGVQSLDPAELSVLGRRHGADAALRAVALAAEAGLSVSADLIAGIPASTATPRPAFDADRLASFARELLSAGAAHLSVYDLSLEEGTPLAAARSRLRFPDEDEDFESRRELEAHLLESGLRRYEVSNYAAVGDECRHNLAYWRMDSYIGAGPGAVSTVARRSGASLRIEESRDLAGYALAASRARETEIEPRDAAFETIMMAFRTCFGLDLAAFRERFGIEAELFIGETMRTWADKLVSGEAWPGSAGSGGPALTGEGMDILNRFLLDCMTEMNLGTSPSTLY